MRHDYKSRSITILIRFVFYFFTVNYSFFFSVWDHGYTVSFEQLYNQLIDNAFVT